DAGGKRGGRAAGGGAGRGKDCFGASARGGGEEERVELSPPMPCSLRLARTTIAIAFQRTRFLMRRSTSRLPGNGGCRCGGVGLVWGGLGGPGRGGGGRVGRLRGGG